MKSYGSPQSGGALTAIAPGQAITMFDGTETPVSGFTSLAFNRTPGPPSGPAQMVFTVDFGAAPTATVLIQASNRDVEADYQTLATITTQHGSYADYGDYAFYRAQLSAYTSGGMPIVICQR